MSGEEAHAPRDVPSDHANTSTASDTGYTFTDNGWIRLRNTWRYLTGGLTEEGVKQYRQGRDDRFEEEDCRGCAQNRDYLLRYSRLPSN